MHNYSARGKDRRLWVGDQIDYCLELSSLSYRRPIDKAFFLQIKVNISAVLNLSYWFTRRLQGYVVNWEVEKEVWDRAFGPVLGVVFS
jgi:actin-related protein 6